MAKQLYDYWFVQFDFPNEEGKPYKSNGGEMVWNEVLKREIPKDWEVLSFGDLFNIGNGKNIPNSSGTIPAYGGNGIIKYVDKSNYDSCFIVGRVGANCGSLHYSPTKCWVSDNAISVVPKNLNEIAYLLFSLKLYDLSKNKGGSSQPLVTHKGLECLAFPYSVKFVSKFCNIANKLLNLYFENINSLLSLTKQRNELLPLLMNGQVSVNSDLVVSYIIYKDINIRIMKENIIQTIVAKMQRDLDCRQMARLKAVLASELHNVEIIEKSDCATQQTQENEHLLNSFISAKKIEGCSDKTLAYYRNTIERLLATLSLAICHITTTDIRTYLSNYQEEHQSSKVTIDNMRRIFSSFFAWLEDEDYIAKSPVRRIHKVKTDSLVKEVLSDEQLEQLRDSCTTKRDLAIIDILASTGIRVGELVKLNREDIDFYERQCVVFGKGNKERVVYFNARTKLHLQQYLNERIDDNPALFVSLNSPHSRLTISGVEVRIRKLGQALSMPKVHPHKFRRTLATMAIDKGMPIEQVQRLLGHVRIDTTLHYAIVNQNNVKLAHKKYLG